MLAIDDLIIGNTYSAKEYSGAFKCSHMGGMNYSSKTKSLVLISKQNNGIYNDKWDYNTKILHYTGHGQVGDQLLIAANKRLLNAKSDGTKVYLFEVFKNGEYFYQGEVELVDLPYQVEELDINGNNRKVWKFPIRKIDGRLPAAVSEDELLMLDKKEENQLRKYSSEQIKERAYNTSGIVNSRPVETKYRSRNPYVSKYVKERSKGIGDLCGQEAPFYSKDGTPYLESHHVITLSNNGPDTVYNAVALCPNCHKKMHVLEDKKDIDKLTKIILKYLLEDEERSLLIEYKKLFKE